MFSKPLSKDSSRLSLKIAPLELMVELDEQEQKLVSEGAKEKLERAKPHVNVGTITIPLLLLLLSPAILPINTTYAKQPPPHGPGPMNPTGTIKQQPTSEEPIVKPGKLVAVNQKEDKCFNKGAGGKPVEVKCPDVIVAKPKPSSGEAEPTAELIARKARAREFVPRNQIKKVGVEVSISGGTYNCYNEDPPNSGSFKRVVCPDIVVLEPGKGE